MNVAGLQVMFLKLVAVTLNKYMVMNASETVVRQAMFRMSQVGKNIHIIKSIYFRIVSSKITQIAIWLLSGLSIAIFFTENGA